MLTPIELQWFNGTAWEHTTMVDHVDPIADAENLLDENPGPVVLILTSGRREFSMRFEKKGKGLVEIPGTPRTYPVAMRHPGQ